MRLNMGIRRRLAPMMDNARRRIELMTALLLTLPGSPVIYYGDEMGMGDNIYLGDRNGCRTPMQWNGDRNAGFSRANPMQLTTPLIIDPVYGYQSVNVEAQEQTRSSLLNWMRRHIHIRKRFPVFGRGTMTFLGAENKAVLAYVRKTESQTVLVVNNLSQYPQPVALDLSAYQGCVPVELLSNNRFPVITEAPYFLSLGGHDFFWFLLEGIPQAVEQQ
jgi:maltose alpha-D-glucosyltransferase / alpha-amylase